MSPSLLFDTPELAGRKIPRPSKDETIELMTSWLDGTHSRRVATANMDFFDLMRRDEGLCEALEAADLITADGAPVVWLSHLTGKPIPERVAGADIALPLIAAAARAGKSIYLLGGTPTVLEKLTRMLRSEYPELVIAGSSAEILNLNDVPSVMRAADAIRQSGADLLLLGLGCPKQELFLKDYLEQTGCKVGIGVGGTFSFLTGETPRAPRWMQRAGLEWSFRLAVDPRRLWRRYLRDARTFALLWTRELCHRLRPACVE